MNDDMLLSQCPADGCGFKCCNFTDNYILMYPGEWESVPVDKKDHLRITGGFRGGLKAQCTRRCDPEGLYKPLDCGSYPLFPMANADGTFRWIAGRKCPLIGNSRYHRSVERHRVKVEAKWREVIARSHSVRWWLEDIRMVGYVDWYTATAKSFTRPALGHFA